MNIKFEICILLFLLTHWCSPKLTSPEDIERQNSILAAADSRLDHDECEIDELVTFSLLTVIIVIMLLTLYIFVNSWGSIPDIPSDLPEKERLVIEEEEDRKDREFLQTFPVITGIVVSCIAIREIIYIHFHELPVIGKLPHKQSMRAYGLSILLNCIPVSIYLIYKLVPTFKNALQSRVFQVLMGTVAFLTLLTSILCMLAPG